MEAAQAVAAVERVKGALDRAGDGAFSCYLIKDGMIHATSGGVLAAAPFPWEGSAYVAGADFERVVAKAPAKFNMIEGDGHVALTSGRFRAAVKTIRDGWLADPPSDVDAVELDGAALRLLEAFEPFICSERGAPGWTRCLVLRGKQWLAVGTQAVVFAAAEGLDFGVSALIPLEAITLVNKAKVAPLLMKVTGNSAAWWWADGGYVRTQLVEGTIPRTVDKLCRDALAGKDAPEITADWRSAFDRVASFAEDRIKVFADRIVGTAGEAEIEDGADTVMPEKTEHTLWSVKSIRLVVDAAHRLDLSKAPEAATWSGDVLSGLLSSYRS